MSEDETAFNVPNANVETTPAKKRAYTRRKTDATEVSASDATSEPASTPARRGRKPGSGKKDTVPESLPASPSPAPEAPPPFVPAFKIVGEDSPHSPASQNKTSDAVVFDPAKIMAQFAAPQNNDTPAQPSPSPQVAQPSRHAQHSHSAKFPHSARPAPSTQSSESTPSTFPAPPPTAAVSFTATPTPEDRATPEDLGQFSDSSSGAFSFSPDDDPPPPPANAPSSESSDTSAPETAPNDPRNPQNDSNDPHFRSNRPDRRFTPAQANAINAINSAKNQNNNGGNNNNNRHQQQNNGNPNNNRPWQQQPKQQGGNGNNHPGQQQGKNRPWQQQPNNGNNNPNQQQNGAKKSFQNKQNNKPQPGRQWGNVTLGESVDERPITLGTAFDYETLNNPERLAELLASAAALSGEPLDFNSAATMPVNDLAVLGQSLGCKWHRTPPRRGMISDILAAATAAGRPIQLRGTLELLENGNGLLVYLSDNYRIRELSAFVPKILIKQHGLQRGHEIDALALPAREGETTPIIVRVDKIMGETPETVADWLPFTELTPYYPTQRIFLETDATATWDNLSMRCVDLLCPVGLGQRGLIVAPPRTGKTILLQGIANAVLKNVPQAHLIILLVDERPEEVTDFRRQVKQAEIVSSTFDENAESHVHAAEMVIERARRMVEAGRHVVILLDSITRLARAYNALMPSTGKILSGGVESNALSKPKRFFGSARNIEGGGSLTILGTALVETGSKMDEVIFEEFKGTGNMELDLDRDLANKRIFPAISFERSGTRKEELLYHPDELQKIYALRRAMKGVPSADAMEQLINRIKKTKTNVEFLVTLSR